MARLVVRSCVCVVGIVALGTTLFATDAVRSSRATVTWISDSDGFWDVGSNWSTGLAPQAGDDVVIDRPGASPIVTIRSSTAGIATLTSTELVHVDAALTVSTTATFEGGLRLAANLGGAGAFHLTSNGEWRGGSLTPTGGFTVHAGRTLTVTTASPKGLGNNTAFVNQGTVVWTEGTLQLGAPNTITNEAGALFEVQGSLTTSTLVGGSRAFSNAGTFRRAGVGATTFSGFLFANTGAIDVVGGTLTLQGLTSSGLLAASADATLDATNATLQAGSTFAGPGTLLLSNTAIAANMTITMPTTIAGAVGGTGILTLGGPTSWVSGGIGGALGVTGGMVVAPGQTLTISTSGSKSLSNTSLVNQGTIVWTDGPFNLNQAVTITNEIGAVIEAQGNLTMGTLSGGAKVFSNAGLLKKSGPFGTLALGAVLENTGVIELRIESLASFDRISAPSMTLGATLRLVHTGGFTPVFRDSFAMFTGGRTGQFATIDSQPVYLGVYVSNAVTVKYSLAPPLTELIRNGDFSSGQSFWLTFALPNPTNIAAGVVNGVMQFNRVGGGTQATVYQETEAFVAEGGSLVARFDVWNTSTTRKRISVLILDSTFADLFVCTFWLAPNSLPQTYQMRTHSTQAWQNAAVYFYAASPQAGGGAYNLDNVSLQHDPSVANDRTDCVDPTTPAPPLTPDGPDLLGNGDFGTGTLAPWGTFGNITQQIDGGVFQFYRPPPTPGTPAGVVLQFTGQPMTAGEFLTATFQLGNSSNVRKRVTVLLHDSSFTDLSACTFWLSPGQALSDYAIRMFATQAWANATLSVYPATTDSLPWILLDNATYRRTPSQPLLGTECLEPGSANVHAASAARVRSASPPAPPVTWRAPETPRIVPIEVVGDGSGRQTLLAWIPANVRVRVEVSLDGETWETIQVIEAGDSWLPIELPPGIRIRLVVVRESPPPSP